MKETWGNVTMIAWSSENKDPTHYIICHYHLCICVWSSLIQAQPKEAIKRLVLCLALFVLDRLSDRGAIDFFPGLYSAGMGSTRTAVSSNNDPVAMETASHRERPALIGCRPAPGVTQRMEEEDGNMIAVECCRLLSLSR